VFNLESPLLAFQGFVGAGGSVLWVIFAATALMWTMIIERLWFFGYEHTKNLAAINQEWSSRRETSSWNALRVRRQLISGISLAVNRYVRIIQALMALLPLLGLLGTVTGMIQIFNVVAIAGTTNARLMAAGVSAATIPTMAGLVAALSGFWFAVYFRKRARAEVQKAGELLAIESEPGERA
jgi:biopolymer transport protein ExbB